MGRAQAPPVLRRRCRPETRQTAKRRISDRFDSLCSNEARPRLPSTFDGVPERVLLDAATIGRLDLPKAVAEEAASPASLLPPGVVEAVLAERTLDFASHLGAQLSAGLPVDEPEILPAAKPTRGRRPLSLLAAGERVLYRALVNALLPALPDADRSTEAFEAFKAAPLNDGSTRFVVLADVASCYQYIDHGIVRDELLAVSGEPFLTGAVIELLDALSGQTFGLPQNRRPSDFLAELVVDIPRRALVRGGFTVWRYNDDFRIGCATRAEAHIALEELEAEVRRVGMTLSDEKSSIRSLEKYEQWAKAAEARMAEVQSDVELDLALLADYEAEAPPDLSHAAIPTTLRLLELWQEDVREERHRFGPEAVVGRTLVRASLVALTQFNDSSGLPFCLEILDSEPSLTPQVAQYLAQLMTDAEDIVDVVLDSLADGDIYVSPWQSLWLFEPLKVSSGLTASQETWLTNLLGGRSDFVSAHAAHILATHRSIEPSAIAALFNRVREAAKPVLAAALAVATRDPNDPIVEAVIAERPILRWAAELADS